MSPPGGSSAGRPSVGRGALIGIRRLLVDGNNLLHRTAGAAGEGQVRQLIARLRGVLPAEVATTLMLDGYAAPGEGQRLPIARNLEIRHSGSRSADDVLIEVIAAEPPWARAGMTLVSDDRALVERARTLGARTQRLAWLDTLLNRPAPRRAPLRSPERGEAAGGSAKRGRASASSRGAIIDSAMVGDEDGPVEDDERQPWKPGRGATRKRGNPRRQPRGRNRPF